MMAGTPHQDVYICCCVLGLAGAYIAIVNMKQRMCCIRALSLLLLDRIRLTASTRHDTSSQLYRHLQSQPHIIRFWTAFIRCLPRSSTCITTGGDPLISLELCNFSLTARSPSQRRECKLEWSSDAPSDILVWALQGRVVVVTKKPH